MDDSRIIELFFARDERAIEETRAKYGRLLLSVADNILGNTTESEECENDTYLRAWDSIPPTRPRHFSAYLCKIVRNLAINRLRLNKRHAPPEMTLIYEEIAEALPDGAADPAESMDLRDAINDFVRGLEPTKRKIFIQRYFYMLSVREISRELGISAGTVKSTLSRTRNLLRTYLTERGIFV